jgi:hypothetical protein
MDATCKTCPFWSRREAAVEGVPDPGYCHHLHASTEEDPQRRGDWWCSEHPLRQRDRLAAVAMQGLMAAEWAQNSSAGDLADIAYSQADAMLAAAPAPSERGTDDGR